MHDASKSESFETDEATFGVKIHCIIERCLTLEEISPDDVPMAIEYGEPVKEFLNSVTKHPSITYIEESMFLSLSGVAGRCSRENDYVEVRAAHPRAFTGTADCIVINYDDEENGPEVVVIDWKTGNPMFARNQLLSLAGLVYSAILEEDPRHFRIMSVKTSPGKAEAGIDQIVSLDDVKAHISRVMDIYREGPGKPVVGVHCYESFCPHREACKGIREAYYSYEVTPVEHMATWSDDKLYKTIVATKVLESTAEKRRDHMLKLAEARGGKLHVEDPQGRPAVFEPKTRRMERTDWKQVIAKAKAKGLTDEDIDSCKCVVIEPNGWGLTKSGGK
jgi:hypothetical protein